MLHHFGKFRRPVALVMLSVFLVAQLLLPLTARAFFFGGVSLKDEKEMGHKFDVAIRSSLPMVDDPEVSKYVDGLVRRLVKAIPPQPFTTALHPSSSIPARVSMGSPSTRVPSWRSSR